MKFLVDEDLSPSLASHLHGAGHQADHITWLGHAGTTDVSVWKLAFGRSCTVITANAQDFLKLATGTEVHAGLIVLRDGQLNRHEQWQWVLAALDALKAKDIDDPINRVVDVLNPTEIVIRDIPSEPAGGK